MSEKKEKFNPVCKIPERNPLKATAKNVMIPVDYENKSAKWIYDAHNKHSKKVMKDE